jgi:choloylglycine hydrolase
MEYGKINVAQFEFIPYILSACATVKEVREKLVNINITNIAFNQNLPCAELHWIIADKSDCITVEQSADGLKVYENNVGVLTNSPPFPFQIYNLNNYMSLSPKPADNRFSKEIPLYNHSFGMGALGLPGDLSSSSRFVRSAYYKHNILPEPQGEKTFFKVLDSCFQPKGLTVTDAGTLEYTAYTTCYDCENGVCYYKDYGGNVERYGFKGNKQRR